LIIGVTGSRTWKDRAVIAGAFDALGASGPVILIEGGAPGADALCKIEATSRGWHVATVRALWGHYGKSAGHVRNDVMVYLGANAYCWLAFIDQCVSETCPERDAPHDSHGAASCIERAELAGIMPRRYGWRF